MNVSPQHNVEDLTAAFELFNTTASELRGAYESLQERVEQLDRELEQKNRELAQQIDEVNRVKDYLNDLLGSITDGVVATDLDGRITAFNRAAERITGFSADQVVGTPYRSTFSADIDQALAQPETRTVQGEYAADEIVALDGSRIPGGRSISLVRDGSGFVTGAGKVFHDLSESTMLREQVRMKDRLAALGEMAATIAHEIRNPLGGIEGFASLLSRDFDSDDPRRRLVAKIIEGAKSLDRVVSDLLEFTRPIDLRFRETDCRQIIEGALSYAEPQVDERQINIERQYPEGPVCASIDGEKIVRVMLNLILNAVQSMEPGGTLTVSLCRVEAAELAGERTPALARITVADTGCGIDSELLSKVFNPFFTTREKGTGLGLAISRRIVEAHHGSITIESEVGRGTTALIDLRLAKTDGGAEH